MDNPPVLHFALFMDIGDMFDSFLRIKIWVLADSTTKKKPKMLESANSYLHKYLVEGAQKFVKRL